MTSRQVRRERREAERKAKKAEWKSLKSTGCGPILQATAATPSGKSTASSFGPELEDEFSPEFLAEVREVRERVARRAGLSTERDPGFVSKSVPNPEPAPPRPAKVHGFVSHSGSARAERNRQNALHSTGPSSQTGKLASSRNSFKHGLTVGQLIIAGEDPAALEMLLHDLLEEHQPANATEELLVNEMAQSYWLAQRAIRLQNKCFTQNGIDEKRLSLFLRYGNTYDRAFHKALNTLTRLQKERHKQSRGFVSQPAPQTRAGIHNDPNIQWNPMESAPDSISEPARQGSGSAPPNTGELPNPTGDTLGRRPILHVS